MGTAVAPPPFSQTKAGSGSGLGTGKRIPPARQQRSPLTFSQFPLCQRQMSFRFRIEKRPPVSITGKTNDTSLRQQQVLKYWMKRSPVNAQMWQTLQMKKMETGLFCALVRPIVVRGPAGCLPALLHAWTDSVSCE